MQSKRAELGFGIMRLPVENKNVNMQKTQELIAEYMKGDFKYFDTSPYYVAGKSQQIIRELVVEQYPRTSFILANKMPYYALTDSRDYEFIFAKELEDCGVAYFDYYMLHALTREVYELHERLGGFTFLEAKKKEGTVKHIGFSFHDKADLLEEILIAHPEVEFVQLQINFLDWESALICARECYEVALKYKKQIIVMEPVKGGSLSADSIQIDGKTLNRGELAALSLAFVARLSGISVILSGMTEVEHIVNNRNTIATVNMHEMPEEAQIYNKLREHIKKERKVQCTACQYCVSECPKSIDIPNIISLLNYCNNTDNNDIQVMDRHKRLYSGSLGMKGKAGDCIKCGRCEARCPQKLQIRAYMNQVERLFEDKNNGNYYTTERNIQILIYLLKVHGIKKIITSPGSSNINFVYSAQQDGFFEMYSAVDERSAAYMACGLAAESGEAVALSCTGATASRNYVPALTEAFYRKLPVLAITSAQFEGRIGNNMPQVIDRSVCQKDILKMSVNVPTVHDWEDEWSCELKINKALLELNHQGGGPVHINLVTIGRADFSAKHLPAAKVIERITAKDSFPEIPEGRVGIYVGAHKTWNDELTDAVDRFCELYNAVVLVDHTSNYKGKYGVLVNLILNQGKNALATRGVDVLIHIGDVTDTLMMTVEKEVWRVCPDGQICDTFRKLRYVYEMEEIHFFDHYSKAAAKNEKSCTLWQEWNDEYCRILQNIPPLPFSNIWIAQTTSKNLPAQSSLHLGIANSLRSWNFFEISSDVSVYSNTGGFGIDGCVSSLIGASFARPDKLFFGVVGDLAFFYDINSLGNRHIGSNLRLMLINNGCGAEFKKYNNPAAKLGGDADTYIAARGHFGSQSAFLVKNYAENLGFEYMSASDQEEYLCALPEFIRPGGGTNKPILLEVFTNSQDESDALKLINTVDSCHDSDKSVNSAQTIKRVPQRIAEKEQKLKVVLWGTGKCFIKNLSKVQAICNVEYVCDNNQRKWDKEVAAGVKCISPEELKDLENAFVVIMLENMDVAFQIANQLLDMGINAFDIIFNWLTYADHERFE